MTPRNADLAPLGQTDRNILFLINGIRQSLQAAIVNHDIWWACKHKDSRVRYALVLNRHNDFFAASLHAHFVAMLVALYRLFETRKDTINLNRLVDVAEELGIADDQLVRSWRSAILKGKPVFTKLALLRGEIFGHLTADPSKENSFSRANLSDNDLLALIQIAKGVANGVSQCFSRDTYCFDHHMADDVRFLLDDLERALSAP